MNLSGDGVVGVQIWHQQAAEKRHALDDETTAAREEWSCCPADCRIAAAP